MDFRKTEFIRSAADPSGFIRDGLPQVAFAGRSNVGKSSVINRICDRKNFARVGSAPGKTVHINYFLTEKRLYLTDLPGYGYAKVSKDERDRWGRLMENYFAQPDMISFGILVVDIRHAPTKDDVTMYRGFQRTGCPCMVLANKADKLKATQVEESLRCIRDTLKLSEDTLLLPFSAEKGTNRDVLLSTIEKSLGL